MSRRLKELSDSERGNSRSFELSRACARDNGGGIASVEQV